MTQRLDYINAAPDAFEAVLKLETFVSRDSGLDRSLIHLVKLRASQINGCAYCVDMHVKEARKEGLSAQWIALMSVWREALIYTEKERAVLRWVEAVTRISEGEVSDDDYARMQAFFSEEEIAKLTVAIGTINVWNRLAVSFRTPHPLDNAA